MPFLQRYGMDEAERRRRKAFLRLTEADAENVRALRDAFAEQAMAQPVGQAHTHSKQMAAIALSQADADALALSHPFAQAIRRFPPEPSVQFPHRRSTPGRLGAWRSKEPFRSI